MSGWYRSYRESLPLSTRLRGEREGPGALRREGEVGSSAVRDAALPPHPDPLRPQGRRGVITLCARRLHKDRCAGLRWLHRATPATCRDKRWSGPSQVDALGADGVHQRHALVVVEACGIGHGMNKITAVL